MRKIILTILVAVVLGFGGMADADIVELNLLDLGCPTEFNWDSPYWTTNFDLGVTFFEISHVYMDWSGEITAGLAILYDNPDEPFPLDVGVYTSLGFNPYLRRATIWGGETTYPETQVFDCLSEIGLTGTSTWSDLLDGQGTITIGYTEFIMLFGRYVEHGFVNLTKATLVVDGVIVPEPATFLLMGLGGLLLRKKE